MLDSLDCLDCLHLTTRNYPILQTLPPDWTADPGQSTISLQKTAHTQTCGRKSKFVIKSQPLGFPRYPEKKAEGYKVLGHCIPGCQSYGFDDEWKVINPDPCKVCFFHMIESGSGQSRVRIEIDNGFPVNNDHWVGPCVRGQVDEDICKTASFLRWTLLFFDFY